jgi:peptidoglycan hydrolase-like protein with peptidoglycan-binding domain
VSRLRDACRTEAVLTPDRLNIRSPKPILLALLAVFAIGVLIPCSAAASSSVAVPLRGLKPGATGPAVRQLQRTLAHLGYAVKPDGQFGPHTASIVRIFRLRVGLPRSAKVTTRMLRMLHKAQNGGRGDLRWLGIRRLAVGAHGHDVRALQNDLTKLGYVATTDGQFGPQTRLSVRSFERSAGLKIDGVMSSKEARTLKKIARAGRDAGAVSSTATPAAGQTVAATPAATTPAQPAGQVSSAPTVNATIVNGLAVAPAGAPEAVIQIIAAGNAIASFPYRYGGGHDTWQDTGYDCSGSVSFALHGANLLQTPMSSYDFPGWGEAGPGQWVTVYGSQSHAYMVVAGLRFDTSASKGGGSRWTTEMRSPAGYIARHPAGL